MVALPSIHGVLDGASPSSGHKTSLAGWTLSSLTYGNLAVQGVIGLLGASALMFSTSAFAQGTAAEAKTMLEKTVAAVKADKTKALDTINKGEGGFLDRDLYPFCFNISDGKVVATGNSNPVARQLVRGDVRTSKEVTGKVYGEDLYAAAKEGQITEVSYMFPKPGTDPTPAPKVSLVTRVSDLGCAVGYYK